MQIYTKWPNNHPRNKSTQQSGSITRRRDKNGIFHRGRWRPGRPSSVVVVVVVDRWHSATFLRRKSFFKMRSHVTFTMTGSPEFLLAIRARERPQSRVQTQMDFQRTGSGEPFAANRASILFRPHVSPDVRGQSAFDGEATSAMGALEGTFLEKA